MGIKLHLVLFVLILVQSASAQGIPVKVSKHGDAIDLFAQEMTPVKSFDAGVVQSVRNARGYGNYVIISHGNGTETLYAHLHEAFVRRGEKVEVGHIIGTLGGTGLEANKLSRLHFEVRKQGRRLNPKDGLPELKLNKDESVQNPEVIIPRLLEVQGASSKPKSSGDDWEKF